jgi:hypothetical protein
MSSLDMPLTPTFPGAKRSPIAWGGIDGNSVSPTPTLTGCSHTACRRCCSLPALCLLPRAPFAASIARVPSSIY